MKKPTGPKKPTPRYSKVTRRMWNDEAFRRLSSPAPNAQTLWFRLLTGPELTNIPGLIQVWEAGLAQALGWSLEGFRAAFAELAREGMASADWTVGLVWVPKAIAHNRPDSPNVVKSWLPTWDLMPDCDLKRQAYRDIVEFMKPLPEGFSKAFTESCPYPQPNPRANQEQEQEQDHEQEQEQESPQTPPAPARKSEPPPRTVATPVGATLFALGPPELPRDVADKHQAIFDAWIEGRQRKFPNLKGRSPRLDDKRREAIDQAFGWGFTVDDLKLAVVGFVHHRDNDSPDTFGWALFDAPSIERGITRALELQFFRDKELAARERARARTVSANDVTPSKSAESA